MTFEGYEAVQVSILSFIQRVLTVATRQLKAC